MDKLQVFQLNFRLGSTFMLFYKHFSLFWWSVKEELKKIYSLGSWIRDKTKKDLRNIRGSDKGDDSVDGAMSFCQLAILSICHFVNLTFCHYMNLPCDELAT
jgi:hypothetical protein